MNKYKSEEGAVLLLLIIMMSAVVLIVASLLKFNTQNIRFAAIEEKQEQALYLAEGVADALDYSLIHNLALIDESNTGATMSAIGQEIEAFATAGNDVRVGIKDFIMPSGKQLLGETVITNINISVSNHDNNAGGYQPDGDPLTIALDIEVDAGSTSRKITVHYVFPYETDLIQRGDSFIASKELNYSN